MTFQDQTIMHGEGRVGDCMQACIASILELPMEAVPHFALLGINHFIPVLLMWLDQKGFETDMDKDGYAMEGLEPHKYHIIRGVGPRGINHAVLGDTETGAMAHDPHPSREGLSIISSRLYLFPKHPR